MPSITDVFKQVIDLPDIGHIVSEARDLLPDNIPDEDYMDALINTIFTDGSNGLAVINNAIGHATTGVIGTNWLNNATYGLAAIKTAVNDLVTNYLAHGTYGLSPIKTQVDNAITNYLASASFGLSVLKGYLDDLRDVSVSKIFGKVAKLYSLFIDGDSTLIDSFVDKVGERIRLKAISEYHSHKIFTALGAMFDHIDDLELETE